MSRMSSPPPSPLQPSKDDPFRYGWRYVRRVRPDGTEEFDEVPLTLEDVLHPEEGDFIVNSTAHDSDTVYLRDVLRSRRRRWRKRAIVLHDCRVALGIKGLRAHGPDIAVFARVRNPDGDWRTFHVHKEGAVPLLIVEVTSPETRVNDVVTKVEHYHRAGVKQYVIVDADESADRRTLTLIAYRHAPERYEPMTPDAEGRIELLGLGLLLSVRGSRVVLTDAKTGEELGDYEAIADALEAERAARQVLEEQMTEAVEARHAAERGRRDAEQRAAQEAQARKAEAKARKAAEKQLARLQAQLAALQAGRATPDVSDEE